MSATDRSMLHSVHHRTLGMAALASLILLGAATLGSPDPSPSPGLDPTPVRFWSVDEIVRGSGRRTVQEGARTVGELFQPVGIGRIVFNLPLPPPYWQSLRRDHAFGAVHSSEDGAHYSVLAQAPAPDPLRAGSKTGTVAHLDEYQAYQKQADDGSLRITVSSVALETVDDNADASAWQCPSTGPCEPVRALVRFHVRAYASSTDGDFFTTGGVVYLVGHQHAWRPGAATTADSPGPLWSADDFVVDGDLDSSGTGADGLLVLDDPLRIDVPMGAVATGELFAVHVSLEAEAVNDRGGESAAQAFIQDPLDLEPGVLLSATGLEPRAMSGFVEPRVRPLEPAECPAGVPPDAGTIEMHAREVTADAWDDVALVQVDRTGGSQGGASAQVTVVGGVVAAGDGGAPMVRFADGDSSPRMVAVPLPGSSPGGRPGSFTVQLRDARCATAGVRDRTTVSIIDGDTPVGASPAAAFRIGGTVHGLAGTGLVLTDLGTDLAVGADGPFTLPGTHPTGEPYAVQVRTQPHDPDQACRVANGRGAMPARDVRDIEVLCQTPEPAGLDATFGDHGRVSTPVGGEGHAATVLIGPDGAIVTAGWRATPAGADITLTRHTTMGVLDHAFGVDGVATVDLGGGADVATDAVLLPDGGIAVVGRAEGTGPSRTDIAIARFTAAGVPDARFGSGGVVRTDLAHDASRADAVAVLPDGRIVVAGSVLRAGIDGDLALLRYQPDGTLDPTFGHEGVATSDLGSRSDGANAMVIGPDDGVIVLGSVDGAMALARYRSDGVPDPGFGSGGVMLPGIDLGVADGVALTASGRILVAGSRVGPQGDRDLLVARFDPDGALDATFGVDGVTTVDVAGRDDRAADLVVDAEGRIVLVGSAASPTVLDLVLARCLPNGGLDPTFGQHGVLVVDLHGGGDLGADVAMDPEGRIVAAGSTADGAQTEFALVRTASEGQ